VVNREDHDLAAKERFGREKIQSPLTRKGAK